MKKIDQLIYKLTDNLKFSGFKSKRRAIYVETFENIDFELLFYDFGMNGSKLFITYGLNIKTIEIERKRIRRKVFGKNLKNNGLSTFYNQLPNPDKSSILSYFYVGNVDEYAIKLEEIIKCEYNKLNKIDCIDDIVLKVVEYKKFMSYFHYVETIIAILRSCEINKTSKLILEKELDIIRSSDPDPNVDKLIDGCGFV